VPTLNPGTLAEKWGLTLTGQKDETFRAAAVQLSPVLLDRDGSTEKVFKILEKCSQEGIKPAVFPETFIPNYPYFAW
jgi:predicted amidohydrolase